VRQALLRKLLSKEQDAILQEERLQLEGLLLIVARLDPATEDVQLLQQTLRQLEELFLLVVVGEFNAGKSAFINALLGERVLPEGVTPTTTQIQVLRHGVPRSDLVLFVTSADRPFSESERTFMERIRDWGKKVIVVVNKIDILEGENEVSEVLAFVHQNAQLLLGIVPQVFPVSARLARRAKAADSEESRQELWTASRFAPLERFILESLDERERIRLKLSNPLGVADRLADRSLGVARDRLMLLKDDFSTIDTVEGQLAIYEEDMRRDFKYHLSHVENVLHEMLARGTEFFDETVRLRRVFDLMNAERVRGEFERQVVADTVSQVEAHVSELIDWMVEKDLQQWQSVMEYLNRRSAQHEGRIIGQVGGRFERSRQQLLASVGRAARQVVGSYDKEKEARQLAESIQTAVAQAALVQVGAIGLGAILIKLLATAIADVTGLLAAGAVAALGLYIIPARRRRAKKDLQEKVDDLRKQLSSALTQQFEQELTQSLRRIREAIAPYTRFVRAENEQLKQVEEDLHTVRSELQSLRSRVLNL